MCISMRCVRGWREPVTHQDSIQDNSTLEYSSVSRETHWWKETVRARRHRLSNARAAGRARVGARARVACLEASSGVTPSVGKTHVSALLPCLLRRRMQQAHNFGPHEVRAGRGTTRRKRKEMRAPTDAAPWRPARSFAAAGAIQVL